MVLGTYANLYATKQQTPNLRDTATTVKLPNLVDSVPHVLINDEVLARPDEPKQPDNSLRERGIAYYTKCLISNTLFEMKPFLLELIDKYHTNGSVEKITVIKLLHNIVRCVNNFSEIYTQMLKGTNQKFLTNRPTMKTCDKSLPYLWNDCQNLKDQRMSRKKSNL